VYLLINFLLEIVFIYLFIFVYTSLLSFILLFFLPFLPSFNCIFILLHTFHRPVFCVFTGVLSLSLYILNIHRGEGCRWGLPGFAYDSYCIIWLYIKSIHLMKIALKRYLFDDINTIINTVFIFQDSHIYSLILLIL
jgi:hypothetical protein